MWTHSSQRLLWFTWLYTHLKLLSAEFTIYQSRTMLYVDLCNEELFKLFYPAGWVWNTTHTKPKGESFLHVLITIETNIIKLYFVYYYTVIYSCFHDNYDQLYLNLVIFTQLQIICHYVGMNYWYTEWLGCCSHPQNGYNLGSGSQPSSPMGKDLYTFPYHETSQQSYNEQLEKVLKQTSHSDIAIGATPR